MKSGKLGCYLLERVNVWKAGHIPVRQYYTLVGTTDHVMDAILDQATERLKTEMRLLQNPKKREKIKLQNK